MNNEKNVDVENRYSKPIKEVYASIARLSGNQDWQVMVEVMKKDFLDHWAHLLINGKFESMDDRNRLSDKYKNLELMLQAPGKYMKMMAGEVGSKIKNSDPYPVNIDEVEGMEKAINNVEEKYKAKSDI